MDERHRDAAFGDVEPGYRHASKTATPGALLQIGTAELKWYDLAGAEGVPAHMRAAGEVHVGAAVHDGSLGFIILHRCGAEFYFLLTSIWRGSNELWQSVLYRSGAMADFAAFDAAYPPPGVVRPTFCVWELGIVDFEARAWSAYLRSARGEGDREAWREARFSGMC
jgi:hypothetical protein